MATRPLIRSGADALLVYPEGDCDTVRVVTLDHLTALVRLPDGSNRVVLVLDLGVGVDDDLRVMFDDGCTSLLHEPRCGACGSYMVDERHCANADCSRWVGPR